MKIASRLTASLIAIVGFVIPLAAAVLIIPVAVLLSGLIWTYAAWRESRGSPVAAAP